MFHLTAPFLLVLAISASFSVGQTTLDLCSTCEKDSCPPVDDCPAGVVKDRCGCCLVCGRLEGQKCDNYTLSLPVKDQYGFCGDSMACLMRKDLDNLELPEALCVCDNDSPVCGSDGHTYATVCQLKQNAVQYRKTDLTMVEWGPCQTMPEITSPPEDIEGELHDELALSCEARGYPIPTLNWHFKSTAGETILLPGDDQMIALQVRGGPEPYMVSSWIQILKLRSADAGTYTCTVSNPKGSAQASAVLNVLTV